MRIAEIYARAWAAGRRPEPDMTVSQWADRYRKLSQRASAEPGKWNTDRTPYLREIMDTLSPSSPWERVAFQKGAQIGGTEAGNNWLGYIIHQAPGPVMAVSPTVDLAKRSSKQRIDPLIEESPALRSLVAPARSRDSGNTVLSKTFPGGELIMTGANSAVGLRSTPVRFLFLDEVDAYPADADGEGDPIGLAIKRTATFARRKVFMVSTPTVAGLSRIEIAFEESDQRFFFVPCPACHQRHVLRWANIKWAEGRPDTAVWECPNCSKTQPNSAKAEMLSDGQWRATAAGDGRTAGFHLSALYSPPGWYSWADAARDFVSAGRNPNRVKVFVNTVLGETFKEASEAPEWRRLYERREDYQRGRVPRGGLVLTAAVDVQGDRIEIEVIAWGRNRTSWSVDYEIIYGDPSQPPVWGALTRILNRAWEHECGGVLHIARLAIDTGHCTQQVYAWVASQDQGRVMAVKGQDKSTTALGSPTYVEVTRAGRKFRRGARLWPVGVSILKSQLYGWLRQEAPTEDEAAPEGWCHWPKYGEEYFKQLTAERLVRRVTKGGFPKLEWELTRDRNEALDVRIYNMAAALATGMDRWSEEEWQAAEEQAGERRIEPEASVVPVPSAMVPIQSAWMQR